MMTLNLSNPKPSRYRGERRGNQSNASLIITNTNMDTLKHLSGILMKRPRSYDSKISHSIYIISFSRYRGSIN